MVGPTLTEDGKKMPTRKEGRFSPMRDYDGDVFECVVMDGSNIITKHVPTTKGNRREFAVDRLVRTIRAVHKLGWPSYAGMKRKTYRHGVSSKRDKFDESGRKALDDLIDRGVVSLIDDDHDDEWLIRAAIKRNGWILSDDRYRKEVKMLVKSGEFVNANEINRRMCRIEFVGSEPSFVLPKNHGSLGKTVVEQSKASDSVSRELLEVAVTVTVTGFPEARLRLPIGVPIGRANFDEIGGDSAVSTISRSHFIIESAGGRLSVTDLQSTNGTVVNGLALAPGYSAELDGGGDSIRIGSSITIVI